MDRWNFLKNYAVMAGGIAFLDSAHGQKESGRTNMCGWRNKPLKKAGVAFVELGMLGLGAVDQISKIRDVEVVALCDIYENRVKNVQIKIKH